MNIVLTAFAAFSAVALGALGVLRWYDHHADGAERARLLAFQPTSPPLFDPAMVADLPDAARRYFTFSIAPGTPLYTVADVTMTGQFSLGTKDNPDYLDMSATQTLAAPHGFVWKLRAGSGLMRISGSDSGTWTRFWVMGLAPVARTGGSTDHARSAFGRYTAEALFWTPAALLPSTGISWEGVNETTARVTIRKDDLAQTVEISVDADGRLVAIRFMRWSDANSEKRFQLQPFGGDFSEYQTFVGFTLPTRVSAGNFYGTDDYHPFFIADVQTVSFPKDVQD